MSPHTEIVCDKPNEVQAALCGLVAQSFPSRWAGLALYAGLLFDRLRLIDYLDMTDDDLHSRIKLWNAGAIRVFEQAVS